MCEGGGEGGKHPGKKLGHTMHVCGNKPNKFNKRDGKNNQGTKLDFLLKLGYFFVINCKHIALYCAMENC